ARLRRLAEAAGDDGGAALVRDRAGQYGEVLVVVRPDVAVGVVGCDAVAAQVDTQGGVVVDRVTSDGIAGRVALEKHYAVAVVEGNDIARPGRRATNRVIGADHQDAVARIRQGSRAGDIGADVIALDRVVGAL